MGTHCGVHIEDASQAVKSAVRLAASEASDCQSIVTWVNVSVDYIEIANLLSHDFKLTKAFLGWLQLQNGMRLDEVRANFKVESLCLVESEIVGVHFVRMSSDFTLAEWEPDQRIIVIALLI